MKSKSYFSEPDFKIKNVFRNYLLSVLLNCLTARISNINRQLVDHLKYFYHINLLDKFKMNLRLIIHDRYMWNCLIIYNTR